MFRKSPLVLLILCLLTVTGIAQSNPPKKVDTPEKPTKTAREFYKQLTGDWKGSYSLWMRPDAAAEKSEIRARFQPAAKGNYYLMTYTWKRGSVPHDGIFLLGGEGTAATATWGDSFHQSPNTMRSEGKLADDGKKVVVSGKYAAGEGPDWGWRTEFTLESPDSLVMEAYNITPDGVEALAVKAELKRTSKAEN